MGAVDGYGFEGVCDVVYERERALLAFHECVELGADELRKKEKEKKDNCISLVSKRIRNMIKRTLSNVKTAYELSTKCESGEYLKNPAGPSSSLTISAHAIADE